MAGQKQKSAKRQKTEPQKAAQRRRTGKNKKKRIQHALDLCEAAAARPQRTPDEVRADIDAMERRLRECHARNRALKDAGKDDQVRSPEGYELQIDMLKRKLRSVQRGGLESHIAHLKTRLRAW